MEGHPSPPADGSEKAFALTYVSLGWALVVMELGSKGPNRPGWNSLANAVKTPQQVETAFSAGPLNQGLQHGFSCTVAIDVDHLEYATHILGEFGLALQTLLGLGMRIMSKEGRAKVIFGAPAGVTLPFTKLSWLKPDAKHPNDRVTIIEFRSGDVQDVLPPSVHPDGHRYSWADGQAPWDFAGPPQMPAELVEFWQRLPELREEIENLCPWRPAQAVRRPTERVRTVQDHNDIIGQFNAANRVEDLLVQGGYKKRGKRYLSPSSSTKLPGVVVFDDGPRQKCYSHHGSDVLADGYAHDAFDLFVLLEHSGNFEAAMRGAALQLGVERHGVKPDVDLSPIRDWIAKIQSGWRPERSRPVAAVDPETGVIEYSAQAPGAAQEPAAQMPSEVVPVNHALVGLAAPAVVQPAQPPAGGGGASRMVVPPALIRPGGFIDGFSAWQLRTAHRPQPILAFAASLMVAGTALGQRVCTPSGSRTNLYIIAVAGTGRGKDHGRTCIKKIFTAAMIDKDAPSKFLGPEGLSSGAALLTVARETPTAVLQIDEFGYFLQAINSKKASAHERDIAATLMKLYSSTGTVVTGTARADSKLNPRRDVAYPCIQVHGTTTPEVMFDAVSSKELMSGFLNRFLIFSAGDEMPPFVHAKPEPVPPDLVEWVRVASNLVAGGSGLTPDNPIAVPFDGMAQALMDQFTAFVDGEIVRLSGTGNDAAWARAVEMAAKLAVIFCCSDKTPQGLADAAGSGSPIVEGHHVSRGCEIVKLCVGWMLAEYEARVSEGEFDGLRKKVLDAIERGYAQGVCSRDLSRNCKAWNSMDPMQRSRVLETLQQDGKIVVVRGLVGMNGKKLTDRYISCRYQEPN